jgi:hypothetical protein
MRKVVLAVLWSASLAALSARAAPCGSPFNPAPTLQPVLPSANFSVSDAAVNCFMWQTFIYLSWPATAGQRGVPNSQAAFGSAGATVWETYKVYNEVYLPGGKTPAKWNDSTLVVKQLRSRGLARPQPTVRMLNNTRKLFRALAPVEAVALGEISQVGGGVLYDQASQPVYYEMLMNQISFDYVYTNQLYNAQKQYQYAGTTGIVLPSGSIEVKAAWKVLAPQEAGAKPLRFHTAQALLPGGRSPVTVGLVGLHVFQMPSTAFNQGFWATFQQVDNAPSVHGSSQASYSFNNPQCNASTCPPNQRTGKPTQVVQMFGASAAADEVNRYVAQLIEKQVPNAPWQFYQLIDAQWPTSPQSFGQPGEANNIAPVPNGSPNLTTFMSPVLETFLQTQNTSCLGCHTYASAASGGASSPQSYQSSLSFLFGHAK